MQKLIKDNLVFLIPFTVILMVTIPVLFLNPKADIHLYMNQLNTPFLDFLAKYITYLGDGTVITIIGFLVLLIHIRAGLFIFIGYFISGFIAQVFKRVFFSDYPRPSKFFEGIADLHLIDGVKLHSYHSFPSGHATTGFAVFFVLAMMSKNKYIKIGCLIMAVAVAYSRVYLSQHFLMDIVAGSLLGTIVSFFLYFWINPAIECKSWSEKSLIYFVNKGNK